VLIETWYNGVSGGFMALLRQAPRRDASLAFFGAQHGK
jgi:hypothetical protein